MYGTSPHGVRSFTWPESRVPHALPEVEILSPLNTTVIGDGGPVIQMTWDYSHTQGDLQSEYRITVKWGPTEITTGWIQSSAETGTILVSNLIPADSLNIEITLEVASIHRGYYATAVVTPDLAFGQPSVRFVQPDPVTQLWTQPQMVTTWEFFDSQGKAQLAFRVRLIRSGQVLHDSGWVETEAKTYTVPFLLQDGSRYQLGLRALNSNRVESIPAP